MLPKPNRLLRTEITKVMKYGRRCVLPELQLVYGREGTGVSRFAFIVSTAIDKRAVVRNRVRRLLREAVRRALPNVKQGTDCVFIARRGISNLDHKSVNGVVERLLTQARLMNA